MKRGEILVDEPAMSFWWTGDYMGRTSEYRGTTADGFGPDGVRYVKLRRGPSMLVWPDGRAILLDDWNGTGGVR